MGATIIDGTAIAAEIRAELGERAAEATAAGMRPGLAAILVGDDPASVSYVSMKAKACAELGIFSETVHLPAETTEAQLIALVARLNADERYHAILPQLPLPPQINERNVIDAIDPAKDVDGLHPVNLGRLLRGETNGAIPCTPHGVVQMLVRSGNDPAGKHVVVVGRSTLVGRPLAVLLSNKAQGANATVTICHTGTPDIAAHTRAADIVVMAAGRPNTLTADMVRRGAVVIDVGTNRIDDPSRKRGWRLVGDSDFEALLDVAGAITPVPGGVGPMTIAMLLVNTVRAAEHTLAVQRLEVP
jgi:methylenetetrahydrofolate dehydrogenase (NADP+)/methenyltetrahydrofolate cyclohydrolase